MERLERAWLWILPWTGYLALLTVAREVAMPAVLTGWVLILVWQMFAIGAHEERIAIPPDAAIPGVSLGCWRRRCC